MNQTWEEQERVFRTISERYRGSFTQKVFRYRHPAWLQSRAPERFRTPYDVDVRYLQWGSPDMPLLLCLGGVANVAHRFDELALALKSEYQVACMDWVGRGDSGWLHSEGDYHLETYIEQARQFLDQFDRRSATVLGSSMGGSVAIALAAQLPGRVDRLILNDTGPSFLAERRVRRAETLSRYYIFRSPQDVVRKIGASQKNDGPVTPEMRIYSAYHQTEWSDREGGRIYRHDMRAMQAYRRDAAEGLDQWKEWSAISCPVLLIHGEESDVLDLATVNRMLHKREVSLFSVPATGHTPMLVDPWHIREIRGWLQDTSSSCLHGDVQKADVKGEAHSPNRPVERRAGEVGPGWKAAGMFPQGQ